jgi:positive regulator of sigma E activity
MNHLQEYIVNDEWVQYLPQDYIMNDEWILDLLTVVVLSYRTVKRYERILTVRHESQIRMIDTLGWEMLQ